MSLVPKISRLRKLPGLLKHKQEAEERSKKEREQEQQKEKRPPFEIEDELSINPDTLSEYKIDKSTQEPRQPRSDNKNVGKNVDVKA